MQIVNLQFERVKKKLAENGIRLSITNEALLYLAAQGYQPEFGARPLKRLIQKEIVNALAKKIIEGVVARGQAITIECSNDQLVFTQTKGKN
jgi:ATP-dependent Clp protease ATP-binding subunit ClpB